MHTFDIACECDSGWQGSATRRERLVMKRSRPSFCRRIWTITRCWVSDLRHARANARAAYSARYILEDMYSPRGISRLAESTGLPEGVIANALERILLSTKQP